MPSILLLLGYTIKSFCSVFLELLGELLSDKFRFVPMKADGGFQCGSYLVCRLSRCFQRVRAVFKVDEEIEVQVGHPSCRSLIVLFLELIESCCIGSSDRRIPPWPSSRLGFFPELEGPCSSSLAPSGNFGTTRLPAD